jgi:hypothetical protein
MLPIIAKASPTMNTVLSRLGHALTEDDVFLIKLNQVYSNRASTTGLNNQARGYKFDQRVPFESLPAPQLLEDVTLESVVQQRAQVLAQSNRPLKLFWSGGIDSTLMCAALLPLTKNITVYHTCESIKENPYFIDYINQFNVETKLWSDVWAMPFDADDLIVTGTSADEITASLDESFWLAYQDQLHTAWQDFFLSQGHVNLIDRCEQLFSQCPVEIQTVFDARWWFYFYIRHTYYARRDWDLNLHNDFGNVISFFDCAEFDSWSMRHKHTLIGNEYRDYKLPFKQATARYWNNPDYVQNKQKSNSYMMSSWLSRRVVSSQQQYLFIYKHEDGYRKFVPQQYPYISKTAILKALKDV